MVRAKGLRGNKLHANEQNSGKQRNNCRHTVIINIPWGHNPSPLFLENFKYDY